jgi:3-oxoacyl-[acyl-carrier-protein] synthase II
MVEGRIIEMVFGQHPKVNSTKSILGHTIGASGALEAAVTVRSLVDQTLHGSRNLVQPIVELDFCAQTMPHEFEHAISQSFGFGGHNAALLFSRA